MTTHTKDKLATALVAAGLPEMAERAGRGHYHDYLSPLDAPTLTLCTELAAAGTPAAWSLRQRVVNGEFDASKAEADEWMATDEARSIFGRGETP